MEKLSYALGLVIGHNLNGMGVQNINNADFAQAVADVLAGNPTALTDAEAQKIVTDFLQKQEEEKGKEAREAGEAFLADNATKEGVVVLPSGLQYLVLEEGNGKKPAATDQVKCHYEGRLIDGTVFDSSYRRGEPATFPLNGVIAG
ncbi:MAG: FKBP-type peptidyl-prolyl cis-trans isomerase, partial [Bacteroidaceae bacterium]|nr:FKBP-type peptidyl-prolyl cis-trans isomerase [Bacteroidaceae bacterium]